MQYEKKSWDEKYRFSKRTIIVAFIIAIILDAVILYFFGDTIFKTFVFAGNIIINTMTFFVVIVWHTVAFAIQNWQLSFVVFLLICFLYAVIGPRESKAN